MGKPLAVMEGIIPDIAAALKVSGEGSARIVFDMDESQLPQVLKMFAFGKSKLLRIEVYESDIQPKGSGSGPREVR